MPNTSEMVVRLEGLPPEKIDLIKRTVAKGSTDDELSLFVAVCNRTGLDPFTRQIHFVKRRVWNGDMKRYDEVGVIQTGIDGYRAVAARTGEHAGTDDAVIDEDAHGMPVKATVTVYRLVNGERQPFPATARFNEYAQKNKEGKLIGQWAKMPFLMISKCAEALALRKAFPTDLSGLYTKEEMDQADEPVSRAKKARAIEVQPEPVAQAAPQKIVNNKKSQIIVLMKQLGLQPTDNTPEAWQQAVKKAVQIELTDENHDAIIAKLERALSPQPPASEPAPAAEDPARLATLREYEAQIKEADTTKKLDEIKSMASLDKRVIDSSMLHDMIMAMVMERTEKIAGETEEENQPA